MPYMKSPQDPIATIPAGGKSSGSVTYDGEPGYKGRTKSSRAMLEVTYDTSVKVSKGKQLPVE